MRKQAKFVVSVFIVAIIAIETVAIVTLTDDWPFGSNSMFAYYRTPDDPVYDIVVFVEERAGQPRRLDLTADLGVIDTESFRRMFFSRWYGSTDPRFPQGHLQEDTPAAFSERMTTFCQRVVQVMEERGSAPVALQFEVHRLERGGDAWVTTGQTLVGSYRVSEGQFELRG